MLSACEDLPYGDNQDAIDMSTRASTERPFLRGIPMKLVLTVLGVVLLIVAGVYALVPAEQLPGFFPGHEAGVTRVHMKHGAVSGVVGLVLIGAGIFLGRR
jgi:hypothetical protein